MDEPKPPSATGQLSGKEIASGEALPLAKTNVISSTEKSLLVVLVGPPNVGKTTLLFSLYDSFQRGPVGALSFAGSQTLLGFEKRLSNYRNINSEATPATSRTSRRIQEALHLRVSTPERSKINLLLADISGEDFADGANSSTDVEALGFLKGADIVTLVVNCEELSTAAKAENHVRRTQQLLRRLVEGNFLSKRTRFHLVYSKADALPHARDSEAFRKIADIVQDSLMNTLIPTGFQVIPETLFIQSLPSVTKSGFDALLSMWCAGDESPSFLSEVRVESTRQFDSFSWKRDTK